MRPCEAPLSSALLLDYWARDLVEDYEIKALEEHLFACGECAGRLQQIAALGTGVATLARQGRTFGIVSREMLNRLQREGNASPEPLFSGSLI